MSESTYNTVFLAPSLQSHINIVGALKGCNIKVGGFLLHKPQVAYGTGFRSLATGLLVTTLPDFRAYSVTQVLNV